MKIDVLSLNLVMFLGLGYLAKAFQYSETFSEKNISFDILNVGNIALKFEYDNQRYDNFVATVKSDEIRNHGVESKFNYKTQKINGVNLGGWLVTEPFITPSLYEKASTIGNDSEIPIDEYTLCKKLGYEPAKSLLKAHWDSWITEGDIIKIKSYGFNAVRLPIGYWAFGKFTDDPYVSGQEEYLTKAITWCRTHGLKLWIDLHGVPGSQNGFDNSGRRDVLMWMVQNENYMASLQILKYIYDKYGGPEYEDVIIGYENLNEPLARNYGVSKIIDFDETTYKMFREKSSNYFVFHDAFLDPMFWKTHLNGPQFEDTVLDHHVYEVFSSDKLKENVDEHIISLKELTNKFMSIPRIQIVGEWSAALTDCAKWLNGVGRGSRLDNTFLNGGFIGKCRFGNDFRKLKRRDKLNTRKIIEAQLDIFNQTNGFFYWTWKTEDAVEWNMSMLADLGMFPVPLDHRIFPKVV